MRTVKVFEEGWPLHTPFVIARGSRSEARVVVVELEEEGIKGTWPNGERNLLEPHGVEFQVMATGFTWDTQNRESDTAACREVWQHAKRMLADSSLDMVLLDELTYMVAYDYLPLEDVIQALNERPHQQTVIITGRGCHRDILELADTVSELRPIKHAFDAGVKAQIGIDY